MPFTPFHIGPAVLIYSLHRGVIFPAVVLAALLPDVEGVWFLLTGSGGYHGILHSFAGAFLVAIFVFIIFYALKIEIRKSKGVVFVSALAGSLSHVLLDALIYEDMQLFWPLQGANPLARMLSYNDAALLSVAMLVVGAIALFAKMKKAPLKK